MTPIIILTIGILLGIAIGSLVTGLILTGIEDD